MTFEQLARALEKRFPLTDAAWDNPGIQAGSPAAPVKRALVALDIDDSVLDEAAAVGADVIITHHPLIFRPPARVTDAGETRLLYRLVRSGICAFAAHTNFDAGAGGTADCLAAALGLEDASPFGFEQGTAFGRVGRVTPRAPRDFADFVKTALGAPHIRVAFGREEIGRVAVLPGSGGDFIGQACAAGCAALVTGDCGYHDFRLAAGLGLTLIDAGHYHTERPALEALAAAARDCAPGLETVISGQSDAYEIY